MKLFAFPEIRGCFENFLQNVLELPVQYRVSFGAFIVLLKDPVLKHSLTSKNEKDIFCQWDAMARPRACDTSYDEAHWSGCLSDACLLAGPHNISPCEKTSLRFPPGDPSECRAN